MSSRQEKDLLVKNISNILVPNKLDIMMCSTQLRCLHGVRQKTMFGRLF